MQYAKLWNGNSMESSGAVGFLSFLDWSHLYVETELPERCQHNGEGVIIPLCTTKVSKI
jgi:hypothetical protein